MDYDDGDFLDIGEIKEEMKEDDREDKEDDVKIFVGSNLRI